MIVTLLLLALGAQAPAISASESTLLRVSPSGHYFTFGGETIMLVGDSGTQCVMQNLNIDYRAWLDDLSDRGLNTVHVWALTPPRQKVDGSVVETRYGYVYPGAQPWARREGGPPAQDQLPQWDLTRFDEGDSPARSYWPRLRDLAAQARQRDMVLGVTLFFGWPKHDPDWEYHPLNRINGGHLERKHDVMVIESPGVEVLGEPWSEEWSDAKKTQWVWERYAAKMVEALGEFDNIFFVYKDERSYDTGNWKDNMAGHMVEFFRRRGAWVLVDWDQARGTVDAVMSATESVDKNRLALKRFTTSPARPSLLLESTPYTLGDPDTRASMWTFAIGGGHFVFHDDERQGTPTTGIMGYDPNVGGGVKPLQTYDWLGHLSRFFNGLVAELDGMAPRNDLILDGSAYALADADAAIACYLPAGGGVTVDVSGLAALASATWYNPRTGESSPVEDLPRTENGRLSLQAPGGEDWALLITAADR